MFEDLNDDNVDLYAAKSYQSPQAVSSEFQEDYQRVLYIKKLLTKYFSSGVLKERLILNHLIIFYNVFGVEAATRMVFLKFSSDELEVIAPFLLVLSVLPKTVSGIKGVDVTTDTINLNTEVIKALRESVLKNGDDEQQQQ